MSKVIAPKYGINAFNCPFCSVYSMQSWTPGHHLNFESNENVNDIALSTCLACHKSAVWIEDLDSLQIRHELFIGSSQVPPISELGRQSLRATDGIMVYPSYSPAPLPAEDMPNDVQVDFLEARLIVSQSPRGAAALLRLCLEKLLAHLGEANKGINEAIKSLVAKGLPIEIQQSLDSLRVIGNSAVHPGTLDLRDDIKTATALFNLLNYIVVRMISEPKQISDIFNNSVSDNQKEAIEKRDGKKNN